MSEFIQPGQSTHGFTPQEAPAHSDAHLDADQLTAFAEGLLPEHEHSSALLHLADCARCRDIAFLAQAALPEPEVVVVEHPASLWKSLFASRPMMFGLTAALACALVLVVVLSSRQTRSAATNTEMTASNSPAPAPASPQAVAPPSPALEQKAVVTATPKSIIVSKMDAPPATTPAPQNFDRLDAGANALKPGNLDLNNLGQAPLRYIAPTQNAVQSGYTQQQVAAASGQAVASTADGRNVAVLKAPQQPAPALPMVAAAPPPPPPPPMARQTASGAVHGAMNGPMNGSVNGGPIVAGAVPDQPRLSGDKVITESPLDLSADNISAYTLQSRALPTVSDIPSHQNVVSVVTHEGHTLALDTEGNLYLSTDQGHRWTVVFRNWQGKAVKLAVASPSTNSLARTRGLKDADENEDASDSAEEQKTMSAKQKRAEAAPRPPFQLITDEGKVWTSQDGFLWKEK